ncbi:Nucleoporin p58/p45 [Phlyctochytrium bullatum]|nr:Nucleoporin p58/p45 [Phlyctochytrium bullatum]
MFGKGPAAGTTPAPAFGATATNAPKAGAPSTGFMFGSTPAATTTPFGSTPAAGTATGTTPAFGGGGLFGQNQANAPKIGAPATGGLQFGQPAAGQTQPSAGLFGGATQNQQQKGPTPGFGFGGATGTGLGTNTGTLGGGGLAGGATAQPSIGGPQGQTLDGFTKTTRYGEVPDNIRNQLDQLEQFIEKQKEALEEIKSSTNLQDILDTHLLIEKVDLKYQGLRNLLDRDNAMIQNLRSSMGDEMKNADSAARYFPNITDRLESKLQLYRQTIDDLERHFHTLTQKSQFTPQAVAEILRSQHESFLSIASKIAKVHDSISDECDKYLLYRSKFFGDNRNPFKDSPASASTNTPLSAIATELVPAAPPPQQNPQQSTLGGFGTSTFGASTTAPSAFGGAWEARRPPSQRTALPLQDVCRQETLALLPEPRPRRTLKPKNNASATAYAAAPKILERNGRRSARGKGKAAEEEEKKMAMMDKAAVVIQAFFRMVRQRRAYLRAVSLVVLVQSCVRRWAARKQLALVKRATLKIQRWWKKRRKNGPALRRSKRTAAKSKVLTKEQAERIREKRLELKRIKEKKMNLEKKLNLNPATDEGSAVKDKETTSATSSPELEPKYLATASAMNAGPKQPPEPVLLKESKPLGRPVVNMDARSELSPTTSTVNDGPKLTETKKPSPPTKPSGKKPSPTSKLSEKKAVEPVEPKMQASAPPVSQPSQPPAQVSAPVTVTRKRPSEVLATLSEKKLHEVTQMHSAINSQWFYCILKVEIVRKEGPRPPSPSEKLKQKLLNGESTPDEPHNVGTLAKPTKIQWCDTVAERIEYDSSTSSKSILEKAGKAEHGLKSSKPVKACMKHPSQLLPAGQYGQPPKCEVVIKRVEYIGQAPPPIESTPKPKVKILRRRKVEIPNTDSIPKLNLNLTPNAKGKAGGLPSRVDLTPGPRRLALSKPNTPSRAALE